MADVYKIPEDQEEDNANDAEFSFRDIGALSGLFWLTSFTFALGTMVYFQFFAFSTDCMVNRFGYTFEEAKNSVAIIPASSLIFSPIAALLIGKFGKKPLVLALDVILGAGVFLYMKSLPVQKGPMVVLCLVLIGLHYAIFVAIIWPAMTLTVNRTSVAAALGLATTIQNFFIATFSYFFGYVNLSRTHNSYDSSFFYLSMIGVGSLILSLAVLIVD